MSLLTDFARAERHKQEQACRLRQLISTRRLGGAVVERHGRQLISFACNDYLGLSHHPAVIQAAQDAASRYGTGAGASRLITGEHPLYEMLENQLAALTGADSACVFASGYLTNLGVIPALTGPRDLILADRLVHACLLDGARLSGADLTRFRHNDMAHLEALLQKHRAAHRHCLILADHIYSMDGDAAPLPALLELCADYNSWLLTDHAHSLGLPEDPAAPLPSKKASEGRWLAMGTLSKAAGAAGGYVCGEKDIIAHIRRTARSLVYTTALPPPTVAAASKALDIMQAEPWRGRTAQAHAQLFAQQMDLPSPPTAIVPWMTGESEAALALSTALEKAGFFVPAIRPPTVPPGQARLRFAFSCDHDPDSITRLAEELKRLTTHHL